MRGRFATAGLLALCLAGPAGLAGCAGDGHFNLFGYTTRPNYDEHIKTVHVPIFNNRTFYRGIEFEVQRAVVREIEAKTPYKVIGDASKADTELTGTIISYTKNLVNRNQLNEVREAEWILTAEVTWTDLRTGEVLSQPRGGERTPAPPPFDPDNPPPPDAKPKPKPVRVTSLARMLPELGESQATARKTNADRLAVQIISLMEKPW